MAGENAASVLGELPLWVQAVLTIGAGIGTAIGGVMFGKRSHSEQIEHNDIAEEFLDSSPIRKFLENFEIIAANQRLQTEALKTISAAAVAMAKTVEEDFNEQRINREIARRLGEKIDR